jgi:RNA polymerase sigma-70 factor (ECF subfamily)
MLAWNKRAAVRSHPVTWPDPAVIPETFAQLVDAQYAPLYRFALSLARNSADAGDLVQQTFFIWATKGHALREAAKAKSWLFTTLYREFLRSRRREARSSSLETLAEGHPELLTEEVDRVSRLDTAEVMSALQAVDDTFRAPLTLFYLQEMSYQAIAETLEVPIGTVMSRLSRGKAQLRAALAQGQAAGGKVLRFNPASQGGQS